MKIKTDFVTNSSSTSYIVFIPKDFIIEKKHITEENLRYDFGDLLKHTNDDWKRSLYALNDGLEVLKEKGIIWCDGLKVQRGYEGFYALHCILMEQKFELQTYNSGPEDGKIHNVGKYSEKIMLHWLTELLSTMTVKGTKNDTTKD